MTRRPTADEVTLARKEAKSRSRITGLRSMTTEARTHVDRLRAANADLKRKLAEALEQQTATSEVLGVISSSPGELEPVFQAMLANATRLCEAKFGTLYTYDGNGFHPAAFHNAPPAYVEARKREPVINPLPDQPLGRVVSTKQVAQVADITATRPYIERVPSVVTAAELAGYRTVVSVPMLKGDELIGAINLHRQEVRPFADKQIALVTSFAEQAVIAIENTRLLNELRQRTDDLSESLEQQTATSEILQVISSSPGELEPVFQAMLEKATRLCEANCGNLFLLEGNSYRMVARHGAPAAYAELRQREPVFDIRDHPYIPIVRIIGTKDTMHVHDLTADRSYIERDPRIVTLVELVGARSLLAVPMLKEAELIGAIVIYRQEVRPFTEKQIELVHNFASQAVIAIENTRLLNELRESLQQQTATAEVLKVISSSPGALTPVFDAMLQNAVSICEAKFGSMFRFDGDVAYVVAMLNLPPALDEYLRQRGRRQPAPGSDLEKGI